MHLFCWGSSDNRALVNYENEGYSVDTTPYLNKKLPNVYNVEVTTKVKSNDKRNLEKTIYITVKTEIIK